MEPITFDFQKYLTRILFIQLTFAWDKPETEDGLMRLNPRKPGMSMTPLTP